MSAPAKTFANHVHLPSVHLRRANGDGLDYDEDLFYHGRGRRRRVERVVRLVLIESGQPALIRETRDILCPDDLANLEESLDLLTHVDILGELNPEAFTHMEERARLELARQLRIANGVEQTCRCCGCSETRACSGGCLWATATLCSRCLAK